MHHFLYYTVKADFMQVFSTKNKNSPQTSAKYMSNAWGLLSFGRRVAISQQALPTDRFSCRFYDAGSPSLAIQRSYA